MADLIYTLDSLQDAARRGAFPPSLRRCSLASLAFGAHLRSRTSKRRLDKRLSAKSIVPQHSPLSQLSDLHALSGRNRPSSAEAPPAVSKSSPQEFPRELDRGHPQSELQTIQGHPPSSLM